MSADKKRVKKRRVFHIPGYDPIHPRRYRELYRKEGAAQAQISGYEIALQAALSDDTFRWDVQAHMGGHEVSAQVDVLVWSDIVRGSMAQTIPATYLQLFQTAWVYITTGALRRLMWMRKGPVIAALYPVMMLVAQLILALIVGSFVAGYVGQILQRFVGTGENVFFTAAGWAIWVIEWGLFGAITVIILRWFKSIDNKLFAYYLMHDYAFSALLKGANPLELETRMAAFGDFIATAMTEDIEEVLIVGHSSGAHLAISILADLIHDGRVPKDGPQLAFLSLGQVVPMVSFLPKADRLRRDLAFLSASTQVTWIDVTAPGDGCCFALCDPVAVTGVSPENKRWPLVISAAFTQSLTPARWKELRWRFFRLHFQYLCAFDQPKDYDYFQITAGPILLRDRYAGRNPSKSRIDVPVSKFTSMKP
jgi:hypothetical protein